MSDSEFATRAEYADGIGSIVLPEAPRANARTMVLSGFDPGSDIIGDWTWTTSITHHPR